MDPRARRFLDPDQLDQEQSAAPEAERDVPARAAMPPLLALQRSAGNAMVSRPVAGTTDIARAQAEAELAMFMAHSWGKENFKPSTGGGLFDVAYDPRAGEMVVTVRIAFKFSTG